MLCSFCTVVGKHIYRQHSHSIFETYSNNHTNRIYHSDCLHHLTETKARKGHTALSLICCILQIRQIILLPAGRMVHTAPYICVQFHALPHKTGFQPCLLQPATVSVPSDDVSLTSVICDTKICTKYHF